MPNDNIGDTSRRGEGDPFRRNGKLMAKEIIPNAFREQKSRIQNRIAEQPPHIYFYIIRPDNPFNVVLLRRTLSIVECRFIVKLLRLCL